MITELRIRNLGVISEAVLTPSPGLTVVTGETGAGKTMIVSGLGLLLGERADPKAVRGGADRAIVEGRFAVAEPLAAQVADLGGTLDEDELLVARQLSAAGRSRAFVGGAQVPAGVCADLASQLITIHGQSEQVRLSSPERQRDIVDRFAGVELVGVLQDYRSRYAQRRAAATELDRLRADAAARAREIDVLRFGLEEIERVNPQPGEDVALAAEATRLQSADDLRAAAQTALEALAGGEDESGGALVGLTTARKAIERAAAEDAQAVDLAGRVADAGYAVAELVGDLARYLAELDTEPGRLEWIAERRYQLAALTRKYGASADEVLSWARESAEALIRLESSEDRIGELVTAVERLDLELADLARTLTRLRRAAAAELGARVAGELAALAMPHARLVVDVRTGELGPFGADQIELLFTANAGTEARSLARVASGGELSRVRLALEVVLAAGRSGGTFVFDEVDAGVGGRVAVEIGRRLALLARHAQVVVVTHLAQVAAFADRHYVVVKSNDGQVTTSGVVEVVEADRSVELARMMAGLEASESALAHADELVQLASAARAGS